MYVPDAGVDVTELSVVGLSLMEAMISYQRTVLIDAIWLPDTPVGEVMQFDAGDLPDTLNAASAHDVDLPTALQVGLKLGASLPDLGNIRIVAVQVQDVLTFSQQPTPPVAEAIPQATACVLEILGYPTGVARWPDHQLLFENYDASP